MNKFNKQLSQLLKEYRLEKGWTQNDVAIFLNVNRSTYANWEQGTRKLDVEILFKICKLYNKNIEHVYKQLQKYINK